MAQVTRKHLTSSEYYQLPEYRQHDLIELIHGAVVIGMPPVLKHQDIVREILILFALIARKLGGKAYDSPIEVRLDDENILPTTNRPVFTAFPSIHLNHEVECTHTHLVIMPQNISL